MKKRLFPIGLVILIVSLLLIVIGPVSAGSDCNITILKQDQNGEALAGATFVISPNPKTDYPYEGELTVVDNGLNDEDAAVGVLLITELECDFETVFTITETVAPSGYTPAPPQTGIIYEDLKPLVLTFVNELIVGGEAQTVNTFSAAIPWIGLALVVIAGIIRFTLKRRDAQS